MRFLVCFLVLMTSPSLQLASGQTLLAEKPEFHQLVPANATVEKLAGGFKFVEGPAWNVKGGFLVFSDIPADKICKYDPATKAVTVFREPSRNANGSFYDADGFLFTCEHGSRQVTRTFHFPVRDGLTFKPADLHEFPRFLTGPTPDVTGVIADHFEGKRLNSPNDLVVKSDGTVWFTDPTYGLGKAPKEQATNNVYCLDQFGGEMHTVATDFAQPNGLCFSPDEKLLYIADSGNPPNHVRVFEVTADNRLVNGRVFCQIDKGVPDGIRCDRHGNLFSSAGDGIHIFAPDGTRLGKILAPETPANLCFGGKDLDELYITAKTSLYRIKLTTTGAGQVGP